MTARSGVKRRIGDIILVRPGDGKFLWIFRMAGPRVAYEDLWTGGSMMISNPQRDVFEIALQFADFFVDESCRWCASCRVGTTLLKRRMEKIVAGRATLADIAETEALAGTVARMCRCGLGRTAPNPILTTMRSFPELYEAKARPRPLRTTRHPGRRLARGRRGPRARAAARASTCRRRGVSERQKHAPSAAFIYL
jgi:hypothetical protein